MNLVISYREAILPDWLSRMGHKRQGSQAPIAMYLALLDKGIFRSTDAGKQWTPINNEINRQKNLYNGCC